MDMLKGVDKHVLGRLTVLMISDPKRMETYVFVGDQLLCTVACKEKKELLADLRQIVDKYAI